MDDDYDTGKTKSSNNSWDMYMIAMCFCLIVSMLLVFWLPQFVRILIDIDTSDDPSDFWICFATLKALVVMCSTSVPLVCLHILCRHLIQYVGGSKKVEPFVLLLPSKHKTLQKIFQSWVGVGFVTIIYGAIAAFLLLILVKNAWENVEHSKNVEASMMIAFCYTLCCFFWVLLTILHACKAFQLFARSFIGTSKVEAAV